MVWKDWCWSWNFNTLATWCEELTHFKRPWCWARLKAGEEGDDRRWDAGWHHWLDGHESEWTLGVSEDREAWYAAIHGVAKSQTRLSDWTDWSSPKRSQFLPRLTLTMPFWSSPPSPWWCHISFVLQWQPTPVLLPGKSHGRRSLVGCSPWGR